jgi:hypothetical protein
MKLITPSAIQPAEKYPLFLEKYEDVLKGKYVFPLMFFSSAQDFDSIFIFDKTQTVEQQQ